MAGDPETVLIERGSCLAKGKHSGLGHPAPRAVGGVTCLSPEGWDRRGIALVHCPLALPGMVQCQEGLSVLEIEEQNKRSCLRGNGRENIQTHQNSFPKIAWTSTQEVQGPSMQEAPSGFSLESGFFGGCCSGCQFCADIVPNFALGTCWIFFLDHLFDEDRTIFPFHRRKWRPLGRMLKGMQLVSGSGFSTGSVWGFSSPGGTLAASVGWREVNPTHIAS